MLEPAILGISPGKRTMGVALIANGTLIDWRIKTTKKSDGFERYIKYIDTVARSHSVVTIAIKESSHIRSDYRKRFIHEVKAYCAAHNIQWYRFNYSLLRKLTLKQECRTRTELIKALAEKKPELILLARKELKNGKTYYITMFEAVAAALLAEKYMNARNAVKRLSS